MGSSISINQLSLWYGEKPALHEVSIDFLPNNVTAIIGPSGCGKSTLIRCINRMNDQVKKCRITGSIRINEDDINRKGTDIIDLRRKVGMVFQRPNPFPFSIRDNVAFGPRMAGIRDPEILDDIVENALRQAAIYDETKDRLDDSAETLSGGQQQRLCIARTLAMRPDVILLDEPCSALDPIATKKIENLILELKRAYTIIIVTHNMQQATRVSDHTAFMSDGRLIEYGETRQIFENPKEEYTERYVTGKFG